MKTDRTPRGMRFIYGDEQSRIDYMINKFESQIKAYGFKKLIMPNVYTPDVFIKKAGSELYNQMYHFKDKKGRPLCLCPEGTAIARDWFINSGLSKANIYYIQKFYRYERPQAGRYREFFQFGVESFNDLGNEEMQDMAKRFILQFKGIDFKSSVKRGLDYYVKNGFEAVAENLGAQKQVLGGGEYDCGSGFAVGIERLVMSQDNFKEEY